MTVAVVTDSSACVPPDIAQELGIRLVPIRVSLDGEDAGVDDVDRSALLERVKAGERLTTSAPSPAAFLEAIDEADAGDGVVVPTLAASMSSTNQSATVAASQASAETRVMDSGTAAGGLGLVVVAAAEAARDGGSLDDVAETARAVADRVRLVAAVGSLEHLARSGRVPDLASKAGDKLGVRPLFAFRDGRPHVLRPSLSEGAALARLVDQLRDDRPKKRPAVLRVTALHADAAEDARRLLDTVASQDEPALSFVSEFDAGMIVHTGPDLVGLAWWWEIVRDGDSTS